MTPVLPTYYLSHGGGPWPWMKSHMGSTFDQLEAGLQRVRREVGEAPRAVLVVSGHWEADRFLAASAARPPMVYDYHGFPPETYRIRYDAPGEPQLAARVAALLAAGGLAAGTDPRQGLDHGTFSLLAPMYPGADMPVVQLSLRHDLDPAAHLAAGRLLAPLRREGVLIVGSGSSFHDVRAMVRGGGQEPSARFDAWLDDTLVRADPAERHRRLLRWTEAPAARAAHPREDHLLPLMVAVGAAGDEPGACVYREGSFMGGSALSSYRFGAPVVAAPAKDPAKDPGEDLTGPARLRDGATAAA